MTGARLSVVIDGVALPDDEARLVWERFSAHMDAHKGDLAGFAAAEGVASVHPESRAGRAVLVISRTAPQQPYGGSAVKPRSGGGSGVAHSDAGGPGGGGRRHGKRRR